MNTTASSMEPDADENARPRARDIERGVLASMQGSAIDLRHLDDEARVLVESIAARFVRARDAETSPLALADGSHMPLAKAERVLAEKECDRAFAALGRTVRRHEAQARRVSLTTSESPRPAATAEAVAAVSDDVRALGPAAREALASLGGVPWRPDADHLARALSLPVPQGAFFDDRARTLLRATREALASVLVRPLAAIKVPRHFTPCVVVHDDTVRYGVRETARARPFLSLLDDGARALVAAMRPRGFTPHESALAFALTMALSSPSTRRRVLDEEKRTAEQAARVLAATMVLRIESALTVARALDESEGSLAHVNDAFSSTLGAPLEEVVSELIGPALDGAPEAFVWRAHARVVDAAHGALFGLALRDRSDETWPLMAPSAEVILELQGDTLPTPRRGALVDLLGPLL
jgi:hypothetical protein